MAGQEHEGTLPNTQASKVTIIQFIQLLSASIIGLFIERATSLEVSDSGSVAHPWIIAIELSSESNCEKSK